MSINITHLQDNLRMIPDMIATRKKISWLMLLCSEEVFGQIICTVVHWSYDIWVNGSWNRLVNCAMVPNESRWCQFKCWTSPICLPMIGAAPSNETEPFSLDSVISLSAAALSLHAYPLSLCGNGCFFESCRFLWKREKPLPCYVIRQWLFHGTKMYLFL